MLDLVVGAYHLHKGNLENNWLFYFYFQFALPHLRKTKGNIINMSSLVAQIGQPGAVAYVASKVNLLCFLAQACLFCSLLKRTIF